MNYFDELWEGFWDFWEDLNIWKILALLVLLLCIYLVECGPFRLSAEFGISIRSKPNEQEEKVTEKEKQIIVREK